MRIQVYPADEQACGFYRMRLPARLAVHAGHEVSVEEDQSPALPIEYAEGEQRLVAAGPVDAELVIFQRPLHWQLHQVIPLLQAQGVAVVVEVDDDFHAVEKIHPAYRAVDPRLNRVFNRDYLMWACEQADWVTASTPSLARRYGQHGRVSVVRNRLDREMFTEDLSGLERTNSIAWAGNPRSHPKDLTAVGTGVLEALRDNRDWHALLVSDVCEGLDEIQVPYGQGVCEPGVPFNRYFAKLATFGIGMAPLRLVPFNTAKSFLKGMEYAAVATPSIASPTGEYRFAAKTGLCETAGTTGEWKYKLSRWMKNDDLRREAGEKAQAACEDWFAQDHFEEWETAWQHALDRRARMK